MSIERNKAVADEPITYPFGTYPQEGGPVQLQPGILWFRLPIKMGSLTHINCYLLEDPDGWTIIDAGHGGEQARQNWQTLFANHLKGKPVKRLICTHCHPDHIGLATWVARTWNIPITMTFGEWATGRMLAMDAHDEVHDSVIDYHIKMGTGARALAKIKKGRHNPYFQEVEPLPSHVDEIAHGDRLQMAGTEWQVMVGRGHSPEHACLYAPSRNVLIGGDIALPLISPHIGVFASNPKANPLAKFLATIDDFRELPAETLVLPSHNDVFFGLHHQLDYYATHHRHRLDRLVDGCDGERTVLQLVPALFDRHLTDADIRMGVSETLAHCNQLLALGRLERRLATEHPHTGQWLFWRAA